MKPEVFEILSGLRREIIETHKECGGKGWLTPENPGELNPCECLSVFSYISDLVESGIPRDYWWLNLDDLEIKKSDIAFCNKYIKNLDTAAKHALGILFHGPNGVGKTSMQCAIGKEAIVRGYTVRYFTAQQYIDAKKTRETEWLVAEYESADFILFDELDKIYISKGSNFAAKTIEAFLRLVTSNGKVILLCTNADEDSLSKMFGDSTMSVLRRHLGFLPVDGADYSENLQDRWLGLLESKKDFFAEQIVSMALRRMSRELEAYNSEW